MLINLSTKSPLRKYRALISRVAALVLPLVLSITASAYTLVLRDGRRIEIASGFTLTRTTLTYEVAPGISKTWQLVLIDVNATERANNEAPGSFFKHTEDKATPAAPPSRSQRASSTLTNRDLEPIQQRRIESEKNYEKRRIELGLPSLEESRRRQAQEDEEVLALIRQRAADQANEESYWRERAGALRSEIVAVDAEINYLSARVNEFYRFPLATHSLVTGIAPFIPLPNRTALIPMGQGNLAPTTGGLPGGRGVGAGALPNQGPLNRTRPFGFPFGFPGVSISPFVTARPFEYLEDSYERAGLQERLNDLLVTRAGLAARWRELENEARTARVPQVWLLP